MGDVKKRAFAPARERSGRIDSTDSVLPEEGRSAPGVVTRTWCHTVAVSSTIVETFRIPREGDSPGRDIGVDAIRGLAILLVVLGHSISNAVNLNLAARHDPLFYISNFLYTFHMPLFFLVSGYVLFGKKIKIQDRALRLLVPFLAWIPVYWFVNRYFLHFPWPVLFWPTLKDTLLHPAVGLWFLPVLFLCSLLLIPTSALEKRWSWTGEASLLAIFVIINFIPVDIVGVMQVKYFFFFFAAGYLLAKHRKRIQRIGENRINVALAGLSILFLALFVTLYQLKSIKPFDFPVVLANLFKAPGPYLIRYSMAFLGIAFAVAIVKATRSTRARAVLAWFGLVTMDIYVAHGLMMQLAFGSGWTKLVLSFVFGIVLSLVLSFFLLRQWWLTAAVFLGIKRKKPTGALELPGEMRDAFDDQQVETPIPEP